METQQQWDFTRHPGPGMHRVLLQSPVTGQVFENTVDTDCSWQWGSERILAFRVEVK